MENVFELVNGLDCLGEAAGAPCGLLMGLSETVRDASVVDGCGPANARSSGSKVETVGRVLICCPPWAGFVRGIQR
jgi:hypothetical protein